MNRDAVRLLIGALVRLALIFFAVWFGAVPQALPAAVPLVSRLGLALLFFLTAMLIGEVGGLRTHFRLLLGAIRGVQAAEGRGEGEGAADEAPADVRVAIDTLIPALESPDAETRVKVHAHLIRLTGQKLPAERAAWDTWWKGARGGFKG